MTVPIALGTAVVVVV